MIRALLRSVRALSVVVFVLSSVATIDARVTGGRIDVFVVDPRGAALGGVDVEISGAEDAAGRTNDRGEARFPDLPPGTYRVHIRKTGFNEYVNERVVVMVGSSASLRVPLRPAASAEVEVAASIIERKREPGGTNITADDLHGLPWTGNPWNVLQSVPAVFLDRTDVGGAEARQQSVFEAKGAASSENTWTVEGVPVTDMAALGASALYYDFGTFDELYVTTGGVDLRNTTAGVHVGIRLKSGSNTPRGAGRVSWSLDSSALDRYAEYGFDVGGPILRDRIWGWGAVARTDVRVPTAENVPDETVLHNYSLKITARASDRVRGGVAYLRNDKERFGRDIGPARPPETTWNQTSPTTVFSGHGSVGLQSNLFVSGRVSHVGSALTLDPRGGIDRNWFVDDAEVNRGSFFREHHDRPQWHALADATCFLGRHEFEAGFSWRRAAADSISTVPGNGIISYHIGYPLMLAEVTAWGPSGATRGEHVGAYLGDTVAWGRLTLQGGVRWDRQTSSARAVSSPASPIGAAAALLPSITSPAVDEGVHWWTLAPRARLSYSLTEDGRTIARLSYGMFGSQLGVSAAAFLSSAQRRAVYLYAVDLNGNQYADERELIPGIAGSYGFDVNNPAAPATQVHRVAPYSAPLTHELQLGFDREVMPHLVVSASGTWRRFVDFNWRPLRGLDLSDYREVGVLTGNRDPIGSFSVPLYGVRPGALAPDVLASGATEYRGRTGYTERFWGGEIAATRRLTGKWMARVAFSTNDHREYFGSVESLTDPTAQVILRSGELEAVVPNRHRGQVVRIAAGSGAAVAMVAPRFQLSGTALYQARWGFTVAASVLSRQGYAVPYFGSNVQVNDPIASRKNILVVDDIADIRLPTLTTVDVRAAKTFRLKRAMVDAYADLFNAFDADTVVARHMDLRFANFDTIRATLNPRVLRVGARIGF